MKRQQLNEAGSLLLPFIIVFVLLLGAIGFGAWAYLGMVDYKTNSDAKSAKAVELAIKAEGIKKDAEFAEKEKSPVKNYTGPATYGNLSVDYPRTWSAYVSEKATGSNLIDGYFSPSFVPDVLSGTAFALRIQVVSTSYTDVLKTFEGNTKTGKVSVVAYRAPKVPSTLGSLVTGQLDPKKTGIMILLPLRDKTIKIWTEGNDYTGDFNNIVLASLSFNP
jgi:hypothetical protein